MTGYLANTDFNWYTFLRDRPEVDEVNFWRPHGGEGQMRQIGPGEPLIFKLKKKYDHAIVGFGRFMMDRRIPVAEAWEVFGPGNGVWSEFELWERIRKYAGDARPHHHIRCLLLTGTVFFPEELWVRGAADWSQNIVAGKYYDLDRGEGARIWRDCLRAAELSGLQLLSTGRLEFPLTESEIKNRYGGERTIRPRLGQGTFRYAVRDAYGKCAVSTEHSLPALEAAHIIPYSVFQNHGGRSRDPICCCGRTSTSSSTPGTSP